PLLEELLLRGMSLGIASNRQQPAHPLKATGLEKYFSAVVGMGHVPLGKPAPDMILKCMADLGSDSSSTLFVGDTLDDIRAARDAGVHSLGLTTGNAVREHLLAEGAWRVIDSLEEFLPLLEDVQEEPLLREKEPRP
ncbi:MAG: HAD family hydrolase, partial [Synergistaceae bacterium]|nr:HAD family hydrolase [Synergistaceae bacterium]